MTDNVEHIFDLIEYYENNDDDFFLGQEFAPFLHPEYPEYNAGFYGIAYTSNDEVYFLAQEELHPWFFHDETIIIPDIVKEVFAGLFIAGSIIMNPELLIPLGLAISLGVIAHVLQETSTKGETCYQIGTFLFKLNKVLLFSTAAISFGHGLKSLGAPGNLFGTMLASLLNISYNILEEDLRFRIIHPEIYENLTGIDSHSCVNYDTSDVELEDVINKVSQKGMIRIVKLLIKEVLSSVLRDFISVNEPFYEVTKELVIPLVDNYFSTFLESCIVEEFKGDLQPYAKKDLIATFFKTTAKYVTETALISLIGEGGQFIEYFPTIVGNSSSMLSRSFLTDFWKIN